MKRSLFCRRSLKIESSAPELRRSKLPTFAAQHAAQSALAAGEGWSCDQYLLRLCEMEINDRETRKRRRLLQASRLPRERRGGLSTQDWG